MEWYSNTLSCIISEAAKLGLFTKICPTSSRSVIRNFLSRLRFSKNHKLSLSFFENLDKYNVLIYPFRTNYDEELKELNLFVGVRAILCVQEF